MTASKLTRFLGVVDLYAQDVSFRENKGNSFTSIFGSLVSITIYAVTTLYAFNKTLILILREDTSLTEYTQTNAIGDETFGFEDTGFMFAIGLAHNFDFDVP